MQRSLRLLQPSPHRRLCTHNNAQTSSQCAMCAPLNSLILHSTRTAAAGWSESFWPRCQEMLQNETWQLFLRIGALRGLTQLAANFSSKRTGEKTRQVRNKPNTLVKSTIYAYISIYCIHIDCKERKLEAELKLKQKQKQCEM